MTDKEWREWGVIIRDPYEYEKTSEEDRDLWLQLLTKARDKDFNLFGILMYLRGTGVNLVESPTYGYKLVPIIDERAWRSEKQYRTEAQYLEPYTDMLVAMLKELKPVWTTKR